MSRKFGQEFYILSCIARGSRTFQRTSNKTIQQLFVTRIGTAVSNIEIAEHGSCVGQALVKE